MKQSNFLSNILNSDLSVQQKTQDFFHYVLNAADKTHSGAVAQSWVHSASEQDILCMTALLNNLLRENTILDNLHIRDMVGKILSCMVGSHTRVCGQLVQLHKERISQLWPTLLQRVYCTGAAGAVEVLEICGQFDERALVVDKFLSESLVCRTAIIKSDGNILRAMARHHANNAKELSTDKAQLIIRECVQNKDRGRVKNVALAHGVDELLKCNLFKLPYPNHINLESDTTDIKEKNNSLYKRAIQQQQELANMGQAELMVESVANFCLSHTEVSFDSFKILLNQVKKPDYNKMVYQVLTQFWTRPSDTSVNQECVVGSSLFKKLDGLISSSSMSAYVTCSLMESLHEWMWQIHQKNLSPESVDFFKAINHLLLTRASEKQKLSGFSTTFISDLSGRGYGKSKPTASMAIGTFALCETMADQQMTANQNPPRHLLIAAVEAYRWVNTKKTFFNNDNEIDNMAFNNAYALCWEVGAKKSICESFIKSFIEETQKIILDSNYTVLSWAKAPHKWESADFLFEVYVRAQQTNKHKVCVAISEFCGVIKQKSPNQANAQIAMEIEIKISRFNLGRDVATNKSVTTDKDKYIKPNKI